MDDFKRTHPIISESTIPPNGYKNIKFGEKQLYIPWRIVDYDENPLDIKGILYPKIFYFSSKYNSETGKMETNYTLINYTLCNETSMKNLGEEFLLDILALAPLFNSPLNLHDSAYPTTPAEIFSPETSPLL